MSANNLTTPTTASSRTRNTRSRFSSPQIAAGATANGSHGAATTGNNASFTRAAAAKANGNGHGSNTNGARANSVSGDGQKTFMDRWLEPPVQVKASYQDAGLVRQGVFENMAPLGTLPKVGLFKKTTPAPAATPERTGSHTGVRRIVVKQRSATATLPSTPAPILPPPPPPRNAATSATPGPATEADETEEEEDQDEEEEQKQDEQTTIGSTGTAGKGKSSGKGKSAGGRGPVKLKLTSSATISAAAAAASASQDSQRPQRSRSQRPRSQRSQSQLSQASGNTENVDEAAAEWAPAAAATHQKSTRRRSRRSVSRASTSTSTVAANSTTGGSQQLEPAAQQAQSLQQQTQQQASHHHQRSHSQSHSQSQQQQPGQNQAAQQPQQLSPQAVARVVQNAVVEALAHQQYPTAWALRTMFDENSASQAHVAMFQRVFNQTASADELVHFGRLLQVRKREGKKNNRAYHYFMPDAPVGQAIPAPQPAPYSDLVNFNMADLLQAASASAGPDATVNASAATTAAVTGDAATAAGATTTTAKTTKPQKKKKRARSTAASVAASSEAAASDETTVAAADEQQQQQLEKSEEPEEPEVEAEAEMPPRKKRKSTRQQQQQQKQPEASASTTPAAPTAPTPSAAASSSKMTTRKGKAAKGKGKGKASATPAETPSSRRRTRAGSVSSISSLSSARSLTPPDSIQGQQDQEHGDQGGPAQQEGEEGQGFDEAGRSQPIRLAQRRRSNAPRKSRNVSPSQTAAASSSSTNAAALAQDQQGEQQSALQKMNAEAGNQGQEQTEGAYELPAVVDSPLFPNLKKGWAKFMTEADIIAQLRVKRPYTEEEKAEFRRRARQMTTRPAIHSSIRPDAPIDDEADEQDLDDELQFQPEPATPTPAATGSGSRTTRNTAAAAAAAATANTALSSARATPAPASQTLTREGRSTRASLKRTHDDVNDDQPSPTTNGGFNNPFFPAGSEAPSTATGAVGGADSRAGTPALRAAKRPRTGLRVKNSPMKKKNGPSAGIPRPSGERSSPVGNAPREDDNDDYCSSCSGNGELVCCDGCTRSFHFGCVDPVLRPEAMPVEWFCNVCRTRREPSQLPVHGGAFALVLEKLDARNSSAFRLPASVRDRFEGVRTGADGEYEEISTAPKPNARKKKNDEEQAFDNYRVRDADGNAVICHKCQQATASDRPIIPCSACGIYWHTDCLDPPMPNPPFVLRTWKCPLHADTLLATFHNTLHPAHRHRKIKDAPVISPTYKRGFANNGHIEVELDDSEDESGWRDVETFGRTVRLSEKGIKLDFISRIQQRSQARRRAALLPEPAARLSPEPTPEPVVTSDPLTQRSLNEQQAALNLARLNTARDDGVSTLIEVMISEANPSVIDLMARVQPSHLENNSQLNQLDQQGLRAILAQAESMTQHIRQLLTSAQPAQTEPTSTSSNTTHLPTSEPLDHETDNGSGSTSASGNTDPNAMDVDDNDDDNLDDDDGTTNNGAASKTPASPAPTDDVPAMTQGEKTPIQGDQSPAVPTATAAAVPPADGALVAVEKGDGNGDGVVLSTPSKTAAMIGGEEPVVLEGEGEEEGQEEKGMEI